MSGQDYHLERTKRMIRISPLNLRIPIQAKVGKIKIEPSDYPSMVKIYFHGSRFNTCQTILTPTLSNDLKRICKTQFVDGWYGHEVELISENGSIRARTL